MAIRHLALLSCALLCSCESATAPEVDEWTFEPLSQQSLVSSDWVMTVLKKDGALYSWGMGFEGTLGQGDLKPQSIPTKIPGLDRVIFYAQDAGMAFREPGVSRSWTGKERFGASGPSGGIHLSFPWPGGPPSVSPSPRCTALSGSTPMERSSAWRTRSRESAGSQHGRGRPQRVEPENGGPPGAATSIWL